MKKFTRVLMLLLLFVGVSLNAQDLLISGIYDGPLTGGTPKGVELYVINNIADMSIYGLGSANNGGGSDGEEFTFPADSYSAGDFIYVSSEDIQFPNWFGFPPDYTTNAMAINGDDAVELFMNGSVIDVYGEIDVDGNGEPWEYMDGWGYRVSGTGPDGSTFQLANFTYSGPNALDGELTNATAAIPFPTGTYSAGGSTTVATPAISPASGDYFAPITVTIACATADADIYYTTDGTDPDQTSTLYSAGFGVSTATTVKARAYKTGLTESNISTNTYAFPAVTTVSTIADLRAQSTGSDYYQLTGEAILTFQQSFRNQKYIQDATAGILIDDSPGNITTSYDIYDGITGIVGNLSEYGGMLQFVPNVDPGAASSTANTVTPEVVTLAQLTTNFEDYEAELVKVEGVEFTDGGSSFANGTVYVITDDNSASYNFRTTFYNVDYIGTTIPTGPKNVVFIPNSRTDGEFVTSRDLADFSDMSTPHIAGSMQGWNASDPAYAMVLNANGLYELTKSLDAGTHAYKLVNDGNWYPGNDQTFVFAATDNVTWKANTANLVTHALPVVAGNFLSVLGGNDWDPAELMGEMTDPDGDDIFTLELIIPEGSYEGKVTLNHNWDQNTGGNVPFTTDGVNATVFTYDFPNNTTTISGPPPPSATVTFVVDDSQGMNYDGFFLKGSWDEFGNYDPSWGNGAEHSEFFDDGTNGDETAGDHIWTCQIDLTSDGGSNNWEWGINDTEHNWIAGNWQFSVPDGTAQTLSWTVPNSPYVIINEIMYNSPGTDEEWVELYNDTDAAIDLEGWIILDSDAGHSPILITAGYSIPAFGYFTIMVATDGFFPFTPDFDGTGNFALNNGGDVVRVYNADGILVDFVEYDDGGDWPSQPDGNGPTLSLILPDTDNSLAESWAASSYDGGTPAAYNFPIRVATPNGGEIIELETSYDITWDLNGWTGDIKIELIREGQNPMLIVSGIPATDELYSWFVFESIDVADDYKILISGLAADSPFDESDDFFSIMEHYDIPLLVFTEIMYNPPEAGDDSLEFIEIFNNGEETVNLEGVYFSQGVEFVFPNVELLPDSFMLVSMNAAAMMQTFSVDALQWTSGGLSNGGEDIELKDMFDNVIDYVDYDDALPWDTLADGFGPSLTLCNPDSDNNIAENWTHSVNLAAINAVGDSIWATPGFGCQVALFASFEADVTFLSIGNGVMFTDLTIGDPTEWTWTFEGGSPDTWSGQTPPEIIYNEVGFYDVTLFVSDGLNTDEITFEDYIEVVDFPAPTNLVAVVNPYDDVQLTWNAPGANELIYDNDVATGSYSYEGYTMATHMSPAGSCKVLSLKYFTTIEAGDNTFNANVYGWDGTQPATEVVYTELATAVDESWFEVDVSAQDIFFDGDFVVGFGSINATTYVGYDGNLDNGRSWDFDNDALWEAWSEAYLIRAVVEYTDGKIAEIGNISSDVSINMNRATNSAHPTDYSSIVTVDPIDNLLGGTRALLGYNVYRDDVQINAALVEVTEYNDPEPPIASHDYYVTAVYDGGESDPSNVVSVVVTGMNELSLNSVAIYPNPTDGVFTIAIDEEMTFEVSVMTITGQEVYRTTINQTSQVNVSDLQKGIYLVRLLDKSSNNILIKKLIVR